MTSCICTVQIFQVKLCFPLRNKAIIVVQNTKWKINSQSTNRSSTAYITGRGVCLNSSLPREKQSQFLVSWILDTERHVWVFVCAEIWNPFNIKWLFHKRVNSDHERERNVLTSLQPSVFSNQAWKEELWMNEMRNIFFLRRIALKCIAFVPLSE